MDSHPFDQPDYVPKTVIGRTLTPAWKIEALGPYDDPEFKAVLSRPALAEAYNPYDHFIFLDALATPGASPAARMKGHLLPAVGCCPPETLAKASPGDWLMQSDRLGRHAIFQVRAVCFEPAAPGEQPGIERLCIAKACLTLDAEIARGILALARSSKSPESLADAFLAAPALARASLERQEFHLSIEPDPGDPDSPAAPPKKIKRGL